MRFAFYTLLVAAVYLGATLGVGFLSSGEMTTQSDQSNHDANSPQQKFVSFKSMFRRGLSAEASFIKAYSNESMLFATVILAVATAFLYIATRDLVDETRNNSERQLRAYIFIKDGSVSLVSLSTGGLAYRVHVNFKNFGQTPGYRYSTWIGGEVFATDCVPFPKEPKPLSERVGMSVIGPSAETQVFTDPVQISDDELQALRNRMKAIFVWGGADYIDAFNRPRQFIFRMRMTGPEQQLADNIRGWALKPHPLGYEEN